MRHLRATAPGGGTGGRGIAGGQEASPLGRTRPAEGQERLLHREFAMATQPSLLGATGSADPGGRQRRLADTVRRVGDNSEHPNVQFVRRGFEALANGDLDTAVNQFSPSLRYYGADQSGGTSEFGSRDELFAMLVEAIGLKEEYTNELVHAYAVGDSLVMAHIRGHRWPRGARNPLDFEYVMALEIADGVITSGVDLVPEAARAYVARPQDT